MFTAYQLLFHGQSVVAMSLTVYEVPMMGDLAFMAAADTEPRRVWMPSRSPMA
jgi:hypothetical protein